MFALAAVTVDVGKTVRVADVDVAFVGHSHRTAVGGGRNTGFFTFELSRSGSPKQSVRLQSPYDDVFAEVDVAGALVLLRKISYGTFDARVVPLPASKPLGEEECIAMLNEESARRGLTAPSGFTTSHGDVEMTNAAWRGHCGVYTRNVSFFSGSFLRDAGVETQVFAGTSTYAGDVLVTFHGVRPKESKGGDKTTLVFELSLERNGVATPLTFTIEQGREHATELEAHGLALGVRTARDDQVTVRLIATPARPPLSFEACEALVRDAVKKTAHKKDAAPVSTVNADGIVTVKTEAWTARCGRYSGQVAFASNERDVPVR